MFVHFLRGVFLRGSKVKSKLRLNLWTCLDPGLWVSTGCTEELDWLGLGATVSWCVVSGAAVSWYVEVWCDC